MIEIQITEKSGGRQWWVKLLSLYLKENDPFEIYCWKNERTEIAEALKYGSLERTNWEYGEVIKGKLTAEFIQKLLNWNPEKCDVYEKMTPIFTLQVSGLCSEHYGTEVYVDQMENEKTLQKILADMHSLENVRECENEQGR